MKKFFIAMTIPREEYALDRFACEPGGLLGAYRYHKINSKNDAIDSQMLAPLNMRITISAFDKAMATLVIDGTGRRRVS